MKKKSFSDLPSYFIHRNFFFIAMSRRRSLAARRISNLSDTWFHSVVFHIEFGLTKKSGIHQGCYLLYRFDDKALRQQQVAVGRVDRACKRFTNTEQTCRYRDQ